MKKQLIIYIGLFLVCTIRCSGDKVSRSVIDFNFDWKFSLEDKKGAENLVYDDSSWKDIRLPHDWSIEQSYSQKNTACSTGFLPGGVGWYRKTFYLPEKDKGKTIWIEFDGVYNNSQVYLNGDQIGNRPNGYSSFSFDLSDKLHFGPEPNVIAVRVDRTQYADSRYYTGSGIYRNVRLVKTSQIHIPKWGIKITTPQVSSKEAKVRIETDLENRSKKKSNVELEIVVSNSAGEVVHTSTQKTELDANARIESLILIKTPQLWDIKSPNLYVAQINVKQEGKLIDDLRTSFGIRTINFDANKGFILNGRSMKLKGVCLHHEAGLVGAAVPKDLWRSRIEKLQSIGCNAVRLSHNPHSPELLDACDELGMLVIAEAFDEWSQPKKKSLEYLGDDAAPEQAARSYTEHFKNWAESDLKDMINRDFNHPSIFMWSIGNEIELTFPYYYKSDIKGIDWISDKDKLLADTYPQKIKERLNKLSGGVDSLAIIARQLSKWVKEIDTTRFVTSANNHPSVGLVSGYCDVVDAVGFNYRDAEYERDHRMYPEVKIYGSENWGTLAEWEAVKDKDYVAGIFVWTGFAYMGEAGPWPRKGLEISFFDFAGFKTPRGHFYECLWKEVPKVYMVTTLAAESEFSYTEKGGWSFTQHNFNPPAMKWVRLWEWYYNIYEKWNYKNDDEIIVQTYTNCEEAELFLNGKSLGRQALSGFKDKVIKWAVKYVPGELKVVGINHGQVADQYILKSQGNLAAIELKTDKLEMKANKYDVTVFEVHLLDEQGVPLTDSDKEVQFHVVGNGRLLGVDNGWEKNVQDHHLNKVITHNGKAIAIVQANDKIGKLKVFATTGNLKSNVLSIDITNKESQASISEIK